MQMEISKANITELIGMQLCRLFLSEPLGKATAPHHPRIPCRALTWSSFPRSVGTVFKHIVDIVWNCPIFVEARKLKFFVENGLLFSIYE
jgi:hypothetical protein